MIDPLDKSRGIAIAVRTCRTRGDSGRLREDFGVPAGGPSHHQQLPIRRFHCKSRAPIRSLTKTDTLKLFVDGKLIASKDVSYFPGTSLTSV